MGKVKTGQFHVRTELSLEELETLPERREYEQRRVWNQISRQIEESIADGRGYRVVIQVGSWAECELGSGGPGERLQMDALVMLAGPGQAEVGELVESLFVHVPDDAVQVRMVDGKVFERDRVGWRRVE